MKKTIYSLSLIAAIAFNGQSQTIKEKTIKLEYSKEAKKASKKNSLYNAGFFMNENKTRLYKLSSFIQKKTNQEMLEVQIFDQNGKFLNVEVLSLNEENLAKFKFVSFEQKTKEARQNLNNLKVSYINNPTLAGKPKLISGTFIPQTTSLGVFSRFKFQKENSVKLEEKFWAQVYYPLGNNLIDRNNYLVQPVPSKKLARAIFTARNSFMPSENKAYVGGLMAVSGSKMFISGIMDLSNSSWVSKYEIKLPYPIYPGKLNHVKLNGGETGILIPSKNNFTYLQVANTGAKKTILPLSIPKTGGQNGVQPSTYLYNDNNDVICFATTAKGANGKDIGIAITKISNEKEEWNITFSNSDLIEKQVLPKKEKIKLKKLKMPFIQHVYKVNQEYLIVMEATKNTSNGTEKVFLIVHVSSSGELIGSYPLPSVKTIKSNKLLSSLPVRLIKSGDSFFVIARAEVDGYEKGAYTDVSSSSFSQGITKTTTVITNSYRKDLTMTAGYVAKINFNNKTSSNVIHFDDFILGDLPGVLSLDNQLLINTSKKIVMIK